MAAVKGSHCFDVCLPCPPRPLCLVSASLTALGAGGKSGSRPAPALGDSGEMEVEEESRMGPDWAKK